MKIFVGALLCLVMGSQTSSAQAPDWQWAVGAGTGSYGTEETIAEGEQITVDKTGNVYVLGVFNNAMVFPSSNVTLKSDYVNTRFFAKYTGAGNLLWAKVFGGRHISMFAQLTIDRENNVVLAGTLDSIATFDSVQVVPKDSEDLFIAKINGNGTLISFNQVARSNKTVDVNELAFGIVGLAIDSSDNIYVTGWYSDSTYFDHSLLLTKKDSSHAAFLAKYSSDGKLTWVSSIHSTSSAVSTDVCIDPNGNPFVTGGFIDTIMFQERRFISKGKEDIFFAKYDSSGHLLFINTAGGTKDERARRLCSDKEGNIYVGGSFDGDTSWIKAVMFVDTIRLESAGNADFFIIKYTNNGKVLWAKRGGSDTFENPDYFYGICVDTASNIYITGGLENGNATFDNSVLPSSHGFMDVFICKINTDGMLLSAATEGSPNYDLSNAIALDHSGNAYITGTYSPIATPFGNNGMFGNRKITSSGGGRNFFLAKYEVQTLSVPRSVNTTDNSVSLFPNPASTQASLNFTIAKPGSVSLEIYDLLGRQMKQISLDEMSAGEHSQEIDLRGLSNGTYICKMQVGGEVTSKIFTVLK